MIHMLQLVFALILFFPGLVQAEKVYYSFKGDAGGGVAVIEVDADTGVLGESKILFKDERFREPGKVRISPDQRYIAAISEHVNAPNLAIIDQASDPATIHAITLDEKPTAIRMRNDLLLVLCDDGPVVLVELSTGEVKSTFDSRKDIKPTANQPEEGVFAPDGDHVLVTYQKDHKKGKHQGCRVIVFSIPDLEVKHDLHLPRQHPELHTEGVPAEQGPNPEEIILLPDINSVILSLDLYGGVAVCDLDDMMEGIWDNLIYIPTSEDDELGHAFPDRMNVIQTADGPRVLVCNAGSQGGACIIDPVKKKKIQYFKTIPGLDTPTVFSSHDLIVCGATGKTKNRTSDGVQKMYSPGDSLHVFCFQPQLKMNTIALESSKVERCHAIESKNHPHVIAVARDGDECFLKLVNLHTGDVVAAAAPAGNVARFGLH